MTYRILFVTFFSFFLFSSCTKEETVPNVKNPQVAKTAGNCVADFNDLDINITWSADCLIAHITLTLCCDCTNGGTNTCFITPGLLEIQVENGPFEFWYGEVNVSSQILRPNTCRKPFHFYVPVPNGGEQIYIAQMWFNGQNININPYTGNYC